MTQVHTKNRKCSVGGCNEKHMALGFCKSHYTKFRRKNDPEYRKKMRKYNMNQYFKHHEKRKQTKNKKGKSDRIELYQKLGAKCISCDEKLNLNLKRSNLHIHHKFYDEEDLKARAKFKGSTGSRHILELRRMIKNGINPNKKFTLLCNQCNLIEAWVRKDKTKSFETFCWLFSEGYFDEALKDDPTLKKLTNFMKK